MTTSSSHSAPEEAKHGYDHEGRLSFIRLVLALIVGALAAMALIFYGGM